MEGNEQLCGVVIGIYNELIAPTRGFYILSSCTVNNVDYESVEQFQMLSLPQNFVKLSQVPVP